MLKEGEGHKGNERYSGFVVDFLEALSKEVNFKYHIQLVDKLSTAELKSEYENLQKQLTDGVSVERFVAGLRVSTSARARSTKPGRGCFISAPIRVHYAAAFATRCESVTFCPNRLPVCATKFRLASHAFFACLAGCDGCPAVRFAL